MNRFRENAIIMSGFERAEFTIARTTADNSVSRGEQSRRVCVVSKAGILLAAPSLLDSAYA